MESDRSRLVLRDYPRSSWFFGACIVGFGILYYFVDPTSTGHLWFAGVGGVKIILSTVLVICVDRSTGTLTLEHHTVFHRSKIEIPLRELHAINLEEKVSRHDRRDNSRTYRIVAVKTNGKSTPFRTSFTAGGEYHMKMVEQLRAFIGIGGAAPEGEDT